MKKKRFDFYVEVILREFGISRDVFFTKIKEREIVDARQMLYWTCHKNDFSIASIIRMMGENGYDIQYPSVRQGIDRIAKTKDKDYKNFKQKICSV
jgi:hypothetical protein